MLRCFWSTTINSERSKEFGIQLIIHLFTFGGLWVFLFFPLWWVTGFSAGYNLALVAASENISSWEKLLNRNTVNIFQHNWSMKFENICYNIEENLRKKDDICYIISEIWKVLWWIKLHICWHLIGSSLFTLSYSSLHGPSKLCSLSLT